MGAAQSHHFLESKASFLIMSERKLVVSFKPFHLLFSTEVCLFDGRRIVI